MKYTNSYLLKYKPMRKTFLLLFMLVVSATMTARSMRSLWISMPPSVIPYLDKSKRLEMLDLITLWANLVGSIRSQTVFSLFN